MSIQGKHAWLIWAIMLPVSFFVVKRFGTNVGHNIMMLFFILACLVGLINFVAKIKDRYAARKDRT